MLDEEALARAAAEAGKPVDEMRTKLVALMKSTGKDEELCRKTLIYTKGNKQWAEMEISAGDEDAQAGGKRRREPNEEEKREEQNKKKKRRTNRKRY